MDARKLIVRSASGLVYTGLIIGAILWGLKPFTCLAAVLAALATVEFEKITHELKRSTIPSLLLDICATVCLAAMWTVYILPVWVFIIICRLVLQLYIKSDTPIADLSKSLAVQIYIGLPIGLMTTTGDWFGMNMVLALFLFIWINDTGAFLIGSMIGRNRLFERISPKKSWEGFFGGLSFNLMAAYVFATCFPNFFNFSHAGGFFGVAPWLGLALICTVFGTWGDLVESMIKRNLNIKDSGNMIPGHGGILDRIDSLLLVMPAAFLYLIILNL